MNETLVERLPPIVDIGPERQLFLDDHLIDSMTRVARYVHQPDRHPENPILVAEHPWEGQRLLYSDVVFDPDETIYKLWYSVYDPQIEESNLCYAVSEDGIHWKNLEEPILDVGNTMLDTHNLCTYDPYEGHYVAYLRGHLERRRLVRRAESTDFRQLNPTRLCLIPDPLDGVDDDFYNSCYCPYPGRQLYLMFFSVYHRIESTLDIQLAVSHDSHAWVRPDRRPIIDLGNEAGEDFSCLYASPNLVALDSGEWRLPFSGHYRHHDFLERGASYPMDTELRWASWQEDRLVGLEAEADGFVTLVERPCLGREMHLNYRTAPDGCIKVELVESPGTPPQEVPAFDGFSLDEAETLTGDELCRVVRWNGKSDLSALKGRQVSVRLHLHKAKVFSTAL